MPSHRISISTAGMAARASSVAWRARAALSPEAVSVNHMRICPLQAQRQQPPPIFRERGERSPGIRPAGAAALSGRLQDFFQIVLERYGIQVTRICESRL